jgi:uncharacterized integral membrane protein
MAERGDLQPQRKKTNWKAWGLGVLVVLVIIFIAQNSQSVKVKFLFVDTTAPLIFLLVITLILGMIIGYITPIVRSRRRNDKSE